MSNLRDQLDQAREAYHKARYPGDLASELLTLKLSVDSLYAAPANPRSAQRLRWAWAGGTASAAAAALVAAFVLSSRTQDLPLGVSPTGVGARLSADESAVVGSGAPGTSGSRPMFVIDIGPRPVVAGQRSGDGFRGIEPVGGWDLLRSWGFQLGHAAPPGGRDAVHHRSEGGATRPDGAVLVDFTVPWTPATPPDAWPATSGLSRLNIEPLSLERPARPHRVGH